MQKITRTRKKLSRKDDRWRICEQNYDYFVHQECWNEQTSGYYYYERGGITSPDSYYYKTVKRHRTIKRLFHKYDICTWSAFKR